MGGPGGEFVLGFLRRLPGVLRASSATSATGAVRARNKVDYRERLSPEDFAVFARLREVRKEIAQADAVPVYAIFTNEQLAQMVQARATTKAALEKIAGVGDARIEKYGPRVLEFLHQQWGGDDERMQPSDGHLFERIVERDNLRLAVSKALRGKRSKRRRPGVRRATRHQSGRDAVGPAPGRYPAGRVSPVHDLRPQGAADHGPVLPRAGAAPRDHERMRAGVRAPAHRRHVRLPPGQGPARRPRSGTAVRPPVRLLPQARRPQVFRQHPARDPGRPAGAAVQGSASC